MRILTVHNLPPHHPRAGGGQRVTADLARALSRRGHTVYALHLVTDPDSRPTVEDVALDEKGVEVRAVPSTDRLIPDAWRMGRAARKLIRETGIDAVLGSSPEAGGVALLLPEGVGLVGQSHHPDPPDLNEPPPLVRLPSRLRWLRRHQAALLERMLLDRSHRAVAVSEWGRDALIRRGYVDPDRPLAVIPNGIADVWFQDGREAPPGGAPALLFVGRLERQKGVDVLLRALAQMDPRPTLRIVGEGPERSALEASARELGLYDAVTFMGHATSPQIRGALATSTALVAPSRWELFGLVLLEAMAAGVPVVASRVGGIPEVVAQAGLLVPPDDPGTLAAALSRLLEDDTLRRRLAREGRSRAETFRWGRVAVAMEKELEAALEEAHA